MLISLRSLEINFLTRRQLLRLSGTCLRAFFLQSRHTEDYSKENEAHRKQLRKARVAEMNDLLIPHFQKNNFQREKNDALKHFFPTMMRNCSADFAIWGHFPAACSFFAASGDWRNAFSSLKTDNCLKGLTLSCSGQQLGAFCPYSRC